MEKAVSYVDSVNGTKSYNKLFHYNEAGKQTGVDILKPAEPAVPRTNEDLVGAMSVQNKIIQNNDALPEGVKVVPQTKDKGMSLKGPGTQQSSGSGS
jgi:hypothetical protein